MKKFFGEFKKFITRGNVIDMAVGIIIGSAFTAIVNAMSNNILKPLINWFLALILNKDALNELYTYLPSPVLAEDGTIDLVNSIYIDWGAFINAIINFVIIAFVLFIIVRIMNRLKDRQEKLAKAAKRDDLDKEDWKILKSRGVKRTDFKEIRVYIEEREAKKEAEAAEKKAKEAAERAEYEANMTTDDILKEILNQLKKG